LGVKRSITDIKPASLHTDELYTPEDLNQVLPRSEYLVLIAPHTPESEKMIGKEQLDSLPKGAILINIGRGALIDENALIAALESGQLRGAGLDVFEVEPLPKSSPLWSMDNVIVSPHSGSTSDSENALICDIFCKNIRNFLEGQPMINLFDTTKMF
jgi:phosphoglycerate dehydrogenase-like enzyme